MTISYIKPLSNDKRTRRIQSVVVMDGEYKVTYWSGKKAKYTNPPQSIVLFCATAKKEEWQCSFDGQNKPFILYRGYDLITE